MNIFTLSKRGMPLLNDQGNYGLGAAQFGNVEFIRKAHAANPGDTLIIWRDTEELVYRHHLDVHGLESELMLHDDVDIRPGHVTVVKVGCTGMNREEYRIPDIGGGYRHFPVWTGGTVEGHEQAKANVIARTKEIWGENVQVEIYPYCRCS